MPSAISYLPSIFFPQYYPKLDKLSETQLIFRKSISTKCAWVLGTLAVATGGASAFAISQKPKELYEKVTAGIGIVVSYVVGMGALAASQYTEKVDRILYAKHRPLREIVEEGLLHRVTNEELRVKFDEILRRKPEYHLSNFFSNLSSLYGLRELALRGIVSIEECRYTNYGIDLAEIKPDEVPGLFPLRSSLFCAEEILSPELQKESIEQERQYKRLLAISDKYPQRETYFGGHMMDAWYWQDNPDKERVAKEQQGGFAREIAGFDIRAVDAP